MFDHLSQWINTKNTREYPQCSAWQITFSADDGMVNFDPLHRRKNGRLSLIASG